jgi:copper homeostasis protein (lipoprotein)
MNRHYSCETIMDKIFRLLVLALCLAVLGCSQKTGEVQEDPAITGGLAGPLELPGSFVGQIPCSDCLRVDITLNLRGDDLYQLRKTYQTQQGPGKVEAQMGRWRFSPEGNLVILGKQKGLLKTYAVIDQDRLRFVEWEGSDIESQIQYDLVRSLEVDPFTDTVKMRGMFSIQEDTAELGECASGNPFSVSRGGDFSKTAQTYMNTPHFFGKPVLLSMIGRLEKKGGGEEIFIEQFNRFYTDQDCSGVQPNSNLTGTYWKLVEIDGKEINVGEGFSAPYLIFDRDKTMAGFGGCNNLKGSYLVQGDVFLINRLATSRIACPTEMETENKLLQALDAAELYRIEGDLFELVDQHNKTKARFRAGP